MTRADLVAMVRRLRLSNEELGELFNIVSEEALRRGLTFLALKGNTPGEMEEGRRAAEAYKASQRRRRCVRCERPLLAIEDWPDGVCTLCHDRLMSTSEEEVRLP